MVQKIMALNTVPVQLLSEKPLGQPRGGFFIHILSPVHFQFPHDLNLFFEGKPSNQKPSGCPEGSMKSDY